MNLDAIVLTGGRSSRLSGEPKSELIFDGMSLLRRTIDAVPWARNVVIVGPDSPTLHAYADDPRLTITRENPAFTGPVNAIVAGVEALECLDDNVESVFILACDMPRVDRAAMALRTALTDHTGDDGVIASSDGRLQWLTAAYSMASLRKAVDQHSKDPGGLVNMPMKRFLAELQLAVVDMPYHVTHDIDTWADAAEHGIPTPEHANNREEENND